MLRRWQMCTCCKIFQCPAHCLNKMWAELTHSKLNKSTKSFAVTTMAEAFKDNPANCCFAVFHCCSPPKNKSELCVCVCVFSFENVPRTNFLSRLYTLGLDVRGYAYESSSRTIFFFFYIYICLEFEQKMEALHWLLRHTPSSPGFQGNHVRV